MSSDDSPFTELELGRFRAKHQQALQRAIAIEYILKHPEQKRDSVQLEVSWNRSTWTVEAIVFDEPWCMCVRASSPSFPEHFLLWFTFGSKHSIKETRDMLKQGDCELLTLSTGDLREDVRYIVY